MKCYVHPEAEAVATCTECGKAACETCAVDVGGKMFCATCLATGDVSATQRLGEPQVPVNSNARNSMIWGLSGWAISLLILCFNFTIGLVTLGLASFCIAPFGLLTYVCWIIGVILGHRALRELEASLGEEGGRGMAMTGLVSSYIGLGISLIACVILAIMVAGGASIPIIEDLQY